MIARKSKSKQQKLKEQQQQKQQQQEYSITSASSSDRNKMPNGKLRKGAQEVSKNPSSRTIMPKTSDQLSEENDEENIVIDMPEEEDDDDDEDEDEQEEQGEDRQVTTTNTTTTTATSPYGTHRAQQYSQQQAASKRSLTEETQEDRAKRYRFNAGDLIWFDPNQLGYLIPGKVLDFYPELSVLTVEGCAQPLALEDPQLDDETRNRLLVRADEQLQVYELSEPASLEAIRVRRPISDPVGLADLVDFEDADLSLETIIWNLKLRFKQELVYTRCGHKILLSLNPHKQLNQLYSIEQVNQYDTIPQHQLANLAHNYLHHHLSGNKLIRWLTLHLTPEKVTSSSSAATAAANAVANQQQPSSQGQTSQNDKDEQDFKSSHIKKVQQQTKAPHIFSLANEALKHLLAQCQDQCFVLLGDSGSGKTETAKLLVQYFATVNKSPTNLMTEQILESIALLESFGNAKTILNNNSSRFGKLLELRFNLASGFIQDARTIDLNLLDRSRIVCQNADERNFNIFYELLSGLNRGEKEKYGLQTAEKYFYLNQGHCVHLHTKDDAEDFRSLLASMQVLGFNYEEQDTIFRILATILHLGNIYFHRKVLAVRSTGVMLAGAPGGDSKRAGGGEGGAAGVEGVEIGSDTEARWVSHLLQVQFDLVMRCLTVRTIETPATGGGGGGGAAGNSATDSIVSPLNIDQALDTRDAIARALYTCLFKWLVQRINLMINNKQEQDEVDGNREEGEEDDDDDNNNNEAGDSHQQEEQIYLCRTSESLCEFQPDKLVASSRNNTSASRHKKGKSGGGSSTNNSKRKQRTATISILDSFGFENLAENNFEQLCVNYAAELLQYHTNRYLVRLEQVEYARERIKWQPLPVGSELTRHQTGNGGGGGGNYGYSALDTREYQQLAYGSLNSSNTQIANSNSIGRHRQAAAIVSLISKKPTGILALLDDECNFPKATDQSFAEKCHHQHALNENYQCARLAANSQEFGIRHFRLASRMVWYQVDGFIEKNRDSLRPDVMELLLGSNMSIVADMLRKIHIPYGTRASAGPGTCGNPSAEQPTQVGGGGGKTLSRTYDGRYVAMKPRAATVAARFQETLTNNRVLSALSHVSPTMSHNNHIRQNSAAMETTSESQHYGSSNYLLNGSSNNNNNNNNTGSSIYLSRAGLSGLPAAQVASEQQATPTAAAANTWFVVCVKPNSTKSAHVFDVAFVQEQVRAMNLLGLAQMRKFGYPVRMRYLEFVKRYKCLVTQKFLANCTSASGALPSSLEMSPQDSSLMATIRTTTSADDETRLSSEICVAILRNRITNVAWLRSNSQCGLSKIFLNEKLFNQLEQMRLREYKRAILSIQKTWKMWLVRRHFLLQREAARVIQAQARGFLERRRFERQYYLVVVLQRRWRHLLLVRRRERLEAKRQLLKQQQREQLQQLQAQQVKLANQTRFRLQSIRSAHDKSLDIPEDLAQLYRLQRNWLPIHDLSNLSELNLAELIEREQLRRLRCSQASKRPNGGGKSKFSVPFIVLNNHPQESSPDAPGKGDAQSAQVKVDEQTMSTRTRAFIEQLELEERFSLPNFLLKYFTPQVPQFGYSRLPITRPFSWSKMMRHKRLALERAQKACLLPPPPPLSPERQPAGELRLIAQLQETIERRFLALEQKALAVYKLILRYIDSDQSLAPQEKSLEELQLDESASAQAMQRLLKFKLISDYINYLCLTEPLLRDEVFLQLASQTWQNPRERSQENCWKLMLNCLACFEPCELSDSSQGRHLLRYLIKYASDYCCDRYKPMVCERLVSIYSNKSPGGCGGGGGDDDGTSQLVIPRRFPTTILEYYANQQAARQLAISASCYMDDSQCDNNDDDNDDNEQQRDDGQYGSFETPAGDNGAAHKGSSSPWDHRQNFAINFSNRTYAQVSSRTTAERLARDILEARQVPEQNLAGWSIEIQHEGALSEFSSRLRGDDHLFDHFARLELLPELVQLIDDDLEALEYEQLDELGVGFGNEADEAEQLNGADLDARDARSNDAGTAFWSPGIGELEAPQADDLPSCCVSGSPSQMSGAVDARYSQTQYGGTRAVDPYGRLSGGAPDEPDANRRLSGSAFSQRYSWDVSSAYGGGGYRQSVALSDYDYQTTGGASGYGYSGGGGGIRSNRSSVQLSMSNRQMGRQRQQAQQVDPYYYYQQQQRTNQGQQQRQRSSGQMSSHRRSMSMQELQLAASSALNDRYFMQQNYESGSLLPAAGAQHYASSCLGPQCCQPPASALGGGGGGSGGGGQQRLSKHLSGSLRQLSGQYHAQSGRRRSATPNSMIGTNSVLQQQQQQHSSNTMSSSGKFSSSSAYGSHSSASRSGHDQNQHRHHHRQQQQQQMGGRQAAPLYMSTTSSVDGRHSSGYNHYNRPLAPPSSSGKQSRDGRSRLRTAAAAGAQAPVSYGELGAGGRPRRSTSSSSRGGAGVPSKPPSDYASAQSDYAAHDGGGGGRAAAAKLVSRNQKIPLAISGGQQQRRRQLAQQQSPEWSHTDAPLEDYSTNGGGGGRETDANADAVQHYAATSSAMSDTGSEAFSLASHVRAVQVPQVNGDLDRYLDDLFNPLLDEFDLGELSDARSMATSIRGTGGAINETGNQEIIGREQPERVSLTGVQESDNADHGQRIETLSPTFERLLNSLQVPPTESPVPSSVSVSGEPRHSTLSNFAAAANLSSMSLSELKALNEKLESEIQAAQSTRASLELRSESAVAGDVVGQVEMAQPAPPPQPNFAASRPPLIGGDNNGAGANAEQLQLFDDIYSRAKTIRIGKWRWPPARDQAADLAQTTSSSDTPSVPTEEEQEQAMLLMAQQSQKKRASVLLSELAAATTSVDPATSGATSEIAPPSPLDEVGMPQEQGDSSAPAAAAAAAAAAGSTVGRLKISSEMKAKLEQLTNSSVDVAAREEPAEQAGAASNKVAVDSAQKKQRAVNNSEESSQLPRRLDNTRRNLLANQLLGSSTTVAAAAASEKKESVSPVDEHTPGGPIPAPGPEQRPDSWQPGMRGKVLAVKQQLAAAAGVALSALDSHSGASSQSSSRRQSSQIPVASEILAHTSVGAPASGGASSTNEAQRRLALAADELGPQSREAISQRNAFYLNSTGANHAAQSGAVQSGIAAPAGVDLGEPLQQPAMALSRGNIASNDHQKLNLCLQQHKQELSTSARDGTLTDPAKDEENQWISGSPGEAEGRGAQDQASRPAGERAQQQQQQQTVSASREAFLMMRPKSPAELASCFTHANVDWQVRVRKEVFKPSEGYDSELVIQLIFAQLVADVFNPRHWTRLNNKERAAIKSIMKDNSIGYSPSLPAIGQLQPIKRELVKMARSFGLYFTRSYQALNFACLSENYLAATRHIAELSDGGDDDDDADTEQRDSQSDDSSGGASSTGGDSSANLRVAERRAQLSASPRHALKLARKLSAHEMLGTDWIDMVAVHHSGLRLVALVCDQQQQQQQQQRMSQASDRLSIRNSKQFIANQIGGPTSGGPPAPPIGYKVLETLKFRDMAEVRQLDARNLLVSMRATSASARTGALRRHKSWLISSSQANQLATLLKSFLSDYNENVRSCSEPATGNKQQQQRQLLAANRGVAAADSRKKIERKKSAQVRGSSSEFHAASQDYQRRNNINIKSKKRLLQLLGQQQQEVEGAAGGQDALLASDDDHDGHRLKQRQTSAGVHKLRSSARSNDVLADAERVPSNDLAVSRAPTSPANSARGRHLGAGKLNGDSHDLGSSSKSSSATSSRGARAIPDGGGGEHNEHEQHQQRRHLREPGGSADARGRGPDDKSSATTTSGRGINEQQQQQRSPSPASFYKSSSASSSSASASSAAGATYSTRRQLQSEQQPPAAGTNDNKSKQQQQQLSTKKGKTDKKNKTKKSDANQQTTKTTATDNSKQRAASTASGGGGTSVWQNSLSRMSNKFNLFGGGGGRSSTATAGSKQAKAESQKRKSSSKSNQQQQQQHETNGQDRLSSASGQQRQEQQQQQQQQQQSQEEAVALDAWIETKVDFDAEDEDHDDEQLGGEHAALGTKSKSQASQQQEALGNETSAAGQQSTPMRTPQRPAASSNGSEHEDSSSTATNSKSKADDGKYSMLQFALYNFREAIEKYSLETRLSINGNNNNNNNNNNNVSSKQPPDDWSTLRGSLKLIESLRNSNSSSQPAVAAATTSSRSSHSTINSSRALTRGSGGARQNDHSDTLARGSSNTATTNDWTWRELAEMVKFTRVPLKRSLLKLSGQAVAPSGAQQTTGDQRQVASAGASASTSAQELERRAIDCFAAIMRYMGDLEPGTRLTQQQVSGGKQQSSRPVPDNEVECVYLILINCHNFCQLRDEVYCQLIKQTTNNRSDKPDSCLRGWRLFSLLAAYFDCSAHFRPYLVNYLEQNAFDKRRSYHSIALLCLQNLRKTFKFKGRKNVPSIEEIAALSAGRISKRQIYRLPGGTERVINTKSTTVVQDIIYEICTNMLMIEDPNEMLEFSLYCIADGDLYTMPLSRDEYILDITTELIKNHQQYFLIFCRSIWHYPLRLDSKLYIEVTFNQIAPDYLEGLLLVLPRTSDGNGAASHYATSGDARGGGRQQRQLKLKVELIKEIARLAALLHRASGTDYMPHKDEIKYLLPKPIVSSIKQQLKASAAVAAAAVANSNMSTTDQAHSGIYASAQAASSLSTSQTLELLNKQQAGGDSVPAPNQATWAQLVQNNWREMSAFDTLDAKAQFLDIIRHWPLFGSSFFAIKLIQRDLIQATDFILALNKFGIQMLDTLTHETQHKYSFNEVISTRKVRAEDGALYLDMKCGNLMKRTIIRIQTDQAHEISRLIRQYIDIELVQASKQQQKQSSSSSSSLLSPGAGEEHAQSPMSPAPSSAASALSSNGGVGR